MKDLSMQTKIGVLAGILFFLHALIPNSHAWPLLWPGMAAVYLIIWMKKSGKADHYKKVAKSLFQTGLVSSIVFFVFTALVLFTISLPSMNELSSFLGAEEAIVFDATLVVGLLLASAIGILTILLIGSFTYFIKGR